MEGWCGQSRAYIKKFNNILDMKKKSELLNLIQEAMEELKPNKECSHLFSSEKFLTGTIVKHNKQNINCLRAGKTRGEIMCAVCDETFKSSRACRVINHCFNKTHVEKLKKKQENDSKIIYWRPKITIASGTYFIRVESLGIKKSQKILFIKQSLYV